MALRRLFPENLYVSGMLTAPPGSWAGRLSSGTAGKVQTALWVPQAQRSIRAETVGPAPLGPQQALSGSVLNRAARLLPATRLPQGRFALKPGQSGKGEI